MISTYDADYNGSMITNTDFSGLPLRPELLQKLAEVGFHGMTLVQSRALPVVLDGRDLLARAQTGSGKTAAFALGLLNALDATLFSTQALVLCPTRELADQVTGEIRRLAALIANVKVLSLCGGRPISPQTASLHQGAHIIVGTPGRVLKHLHKATLGLQDLRTLVLDEADRMLDMGFSDEIDALLAFVPVPRQTLLFSATYPDAIAAISSRVQREPVYVDVTSQEAPLAIAQHWLRVSGENREHVLGVALRSWGGARNLIFCNTKIACASVAKSLQQTGIVAAALHGDLQQAERTEVLIRFANGSISALVATDVAARGLDISKLDAVFNFELPAQPESYVHRIGRTGRAGNSGIAVSLVAARERSRLEAIRALAPDLGEQPSDLPRDRTQLQQPQMVTLAINGGRKHKLRPGDVLGALTASGEVSGAQVGKIDLLDYSGYVAVSASHVNAALTQLNSQRIKGARYKARLCRKP